MLHSLRYASILKVLEKSGYRDGSHRIVEIGAGISGISPYIKGRFIGCDLSFPGKPPVRTFALCPCRFPGVGGVACTCDGMSRWRRLHALSHCDSCCSFRSTGTRTLQARIVVNRPGMSGDSLV